MKLNKQLPDSYMNQILNKLKELVQKVEQCFQSVSNGKQLVASAITGKGVTTASDATFETMANNINSIKDVANNTAGTATAANIAKDKTAWVNGTKLTGTLVATSITKNESKSSSYSIGGYGSTTVTLTYSNTVLGVVSYSITDSNNYAKLTSISISGKTITFGMQTYHGHGASGTLTVTAKIAS